VCVCVCVCVCRCVCVPVCVCVYRDQYAMHAESKTANVFSIECVV
jgi:hypothetical protein